MGNGPTVVSLTWKILIGRLTKLYSCYRIPILFFGASPLQPKKKNNVNQQYWPSTEQQPHVGGRGEAGRREVNANVCQNILEDFQ